MRALAAFVAGLAASAALAFPGSAVPASDACLFTGQRYPSVGLEKAGHHYIIVVKRGLLCLEAVAIARRAGRIGNPGPYRPFRSGIWSCLSIVSREYPTVAAGQCQKEGSSVFVSWSAACPPGGNCKKLRRG
ncbi:MAG: hypothetical protein FJW96_09150 [Actinobacteria bacterium]|nr:hypothetical protein [Actinomycetota bacterium]